MSLLTAQHELTPQHETQSIPSVAVDVFQERLLFAFSEGDSSVFFPSYGNNFPGQGTRTWVDTNTFKSNDHWVGYLKELMPTIIVSCWSTPPLPVSLLESDSFPLRYLCHTTGSVRGKVPRDFVARGGLVTNWGNTISHNVAEHALLLILASFRNLAAWRPSLTASPHTCWGNAQMLRTKSLRGKRVGIHGIGNVAREMIRLLEPFDVECRAFSENVSPSFIVEQGAKPCRDLRELFKNSDVIVECEGLTDQSAGSVTEEHLRLMPEGALFVNVGRGAVVDERGLARVAAEGRIQVASDVFETEPIPADSPLLAMEDVLISPHIAGPTADWFPRCGDYALENIDRYLSGQTLNGVVSLEIYDRTT